MIQYPLFIPTRNANANYTSGPIALADWSNYWIGVTISGSDVVGTLSLECAATKDFARPFPVDSSSTNITASGEKYFNLSNQNYPYVRIVWVYTSGTGNLSADVTIPRRVVTDVA